MVEAESAVQQGRRHVAEHASEIWVNLRKNNLWKRIVKNVITTILLGRILGNAQERQSFTHVLQSAYVSSQAPRRRLVKLLTSARLLLSSLILAEGSAR